MGIFNKMKEKFSCDHNYHYVRTYHREAYYDDRTNSFVKPLGFIVKCIKCGKRKDVSRSWCKRNAVSLPSTTFHPAPKRSTAKEMAERRKKRNKTTKENSK